MVSSSSIIPILTNETVKVPFGTLIGEVREFSKRISFEKGVKIQKAELRLTGQQGYLSGAGLDVAMNGLEQKPGIDWHAGENGKKTSTYNVTTLLMDGVNTFSVVYSTAFGVLTEQQCITSVDLIVQLDKPNTGSPGYTTGDPVESGFWDRLGHTVKEGANYGS